MSLGELAILLAFGGLICVLCGVAHEAIYQAVHKDGLAPLWFMYPAAALATLSVVTMFIAMCN